jgi:hypothetical protein
MKLLTAIIVTLVLIFSGPGAYGQGEPAGPPEAGAQEGALKSKEDNRLPIQKEEWQFFLAPYIWIPGINAQTTLNGHTSNINVGWWDTASDLFSSAFGAMGRFEAWKGRWGFFLDSYFTYLGSNVSDSAGKEILLGRLPVPRTLVLSGNLKYIVRAANLDFGGRYLVGTVPLRAEKPLPIMSFEVLGGGRFNSYNQYLRLGVTATFTGPLVDRTAGQVFINKLDRSYVEPFLGFRLGFWLTEKTVITFSGDVGGFGFAADSNLDSNLELNFGYRVHPGIYAYIGYRAFYNQFSQSELSFSGWIHGPMLGAVFTL